MRPFYTSLTVDRPARNFPQQKLSGHSHPLSLCGAYLGSCFSKFSLVSKYPLFHNDFNHGLVKKASMAFAQPCIRGGTERGRLKPILV
jgi:hypothetical protein